MSIDIQLHEKRPAVGEVDNPRNETLLDTTTVSQTSDWDSNRGQELDHVDLQPRSDETRSPNVFDNKEDPCQPYLKAYPGTKFGSKIRRFSSNWYSE